YGGHAVAAGFTLHPENWDAFVQRMRAVAESKLTGLTLRPQLRVDAEVSLADLTGRLARQMEFFEPTGYGNPAPVFAARNVSVASVRRMGADGQHLKLQLQHAGSASVEAVAFGEGAAADTMPRQIDVAFNLELNEWQGRRSVQLRLRDWQPAT
ncbi:MAG: single-stranded-DNA-specific exonuclease RecJ, partial [Chloroflexi bacterium]